MNTQREGIQAGVVRRAREFADRRGYKGGGFEQLDYAKALSELSPEERACERGFIPAREPSQPLRASRHFAERVQHFTQQGHTRSTAIAKATEEERRSGLYELRANLPRNSPWAIEGTQRRREQVAVFSKLVGTLDGGTLRRYEAGGAPGETTHEASLRTAREVLPRQVAAAVLYRGGSQPSQAEREWLDHWYGVLNPPPQPVTGGGNAAAIVGYNRQRERFLDDMMEQARQLLRDSAERAKLQPTKLGG